MEKHPNLSAYDDVENLSRFTIETFKSYCNNKLKECEDEVLFIEKHCKDSQWQGKVAEIGSGNSKLLYSLEKAGLLTEGLGYEISKSRNIFAEEFKKNVGSKKVQNINNDFLKEALPYEFDLVLGMDIVFQFIAPLYPNAELDCLNWIYRSLRKNGTLIFELRDFEDFDKQIKNANNNVVYSWEEFAPTDPFEFVLAKLFYDSDKNLCWDKLFLERNSLNRSSFTNILKPYTRESIKELLERVNFNSIEIFNGVTDSVASETYIVKAKK